MVSAKPESGVLLITVAPFDEKFRITGQELKGGCGRRLGATARMRMWMKPMRSGEVGRFVDEYGAPMGKESGGGAALGY